MVLEAANKLKLSTRYVYRLIHSYRQSHGLMTSIIPQKPNGGKGRSRLSKQQEEVINQPRWSERVISAMKNRKT